MRELAVAAALMLAPFQPAVVPEMDDPTIVGRTVVVEPIGATRVELNGVRFRGPLTVTGHSSGLAVTELTSVESYLEGIAEVPFAWHPETLKAQAVAARTYLAWTLDRGRSANGRAYGYDICATTACQVYSGVEYSEGEFGRPWRTAVDATADELLVHQGRPAQALYSSTSGGRTRSVEDVFPGASPTPYLRAVESPGEDSPFVEWGFELSETNMAALLDQAGLLEGALVDIRTTLTEDGGGSWIVDIVGTEGTTTIGTWRLRTALNAAAAAALPDLLPPMRPDVDRRYPQTILSPSFVIESDVRLLYYRGWPPETKLVFEIRGNGWGHNVGMSQYGAEAMANDGVGYGDILAHYYGGLRPQESPDLLPASVVVGLATEEPELTFSADGPLRVVVDGEVAADAALGSWRFFADDGLIRIEPPTGLGLPPRIVDLRVVRLGRSIAALEVLSATAAEIRLSVRTGDDWLPRSEWELVEAGPVRWSWWELGPAVDGHLARVEVRSPLGTDERIVALVAGAE